MPEAGVIDPACAAGAAARAAAARARTRRIVRRMPSSSSHPSGSRHTAIRWSWLPDLRGRALPPKRSVLDQDRQRRAGGFRLLDALAQALVGLGDILELVRRDEVEDLRAGDHALAVVVARLLVDGDFHASTPGSKVIGSSTGPVTPLIGRSTGAPSSRGRRSRRARIGSASRMSMRASQWPRQWWAPPPKPKWARRSTVMSNGSSPTASGSVFAGGLKRCIVVPA